jgi:outer membrane lipoprotein carrier protein
LPFAVLALAALLCLGSGSTQADSRVDAERVAARVQRFHEQVDSLQAHFYQTHYHRLYDRYQRSKGRLSISKPGKLRFDYARPNGKVIATDGRSLTAYDPGDEGEAGQYVKRPMGAGALPGAFAFLTGEGDLQEDFRFRLLDTRNWTFPGHILELRPRTPDPRYRRIILFVDSRPRSFGVVHGLRIDDHDGNRNKIELSHMRYNRPVNPAHFAFQPPAGARRIRM